MKIYLVRNFETKGVLGVFWAASALDLWWTIDENADPGEYEYTVVRKPGGIVFPEDEPDAAQWNEYREGANPPEFSWGEATTTENLDEVLHFQSDQRWRKIPYADEEGGGVHDLINRAGGDKRLP